MKHDPKLEYALRNHPEMFEDQTGFVASVPVATFSIGALVTQDKPRPNQTVGDAMNTVFVKDGKLFEERPTGRIGASGMEFELVPIEGSVTVYKGAPMISDELYHMLDAILINLAHGLPVPRADVTKAQFLLRHDCLGHDLPPHLVEKGL